MKEVDLQIFDSMKNDFFEGEISLEVAQAYMAANQELPKEPTRLQVLNFHKCKMIIDPEYHHRFLNPKTRTHIQYPDHNEEKEKLSYRRLGGEIEKLYKIAAEHKMDVVDFLNNPPQGIHFKKYSTFHGEEVALNFIKKTLQSGILIDSKNNRLTGEIRLKYLNSLPGTSFPECHNGVILMYATSGSNLGIDLDIPMGPNPNPMKPCNGIKLSFKKNGKLHAFPCIVKEETLKNNLPFMLAPKPSNSKPTLDKTSQQLPGSKAQAADVNQPRPKRKAEEWLEKTRAQKKTSINIVTSPSNHSQERQQTVNHNHPVAPSFPEQQIREVSSPSTENATMHDPEPTLHSAITIETNQAVSVLEHTPAASHDTVSSTTGNVTNHPSHRSTLEKSMAEPKPQATQGVKRKAEIMMDRIRVERRSQSTAASAKPQNRVYTPATSNFFKAGAPRNLMPERAAQLGPRLAPNNQPRPPRINPFPVQPAQRSTPTPSYKPAPPSIARPTPTPRTITSNPTRPPPQPLYRPPPPVNIVRPLPPPRPNNMTVRSPIIKPVPRPAPPPPIMVSKPPPTYLPLYNSRKR